MKSLASVLIFLLFCFSTSFLIPFCSGSEIGGLHYVYWNFPFPTFTKFSIDVEILTDPTNQNGLYYQMYQGYINGKGFYFGLQTRLYKPANESTGEPSSIGRGLIFSRWGTRDLANVRTVEGGWSESAGYEDDFVSVRRLYNWTTHTYRFVLTLIDTDEVGDWYEVSITDVNQQTTDILGAIRFQKVEQNEGANGIANWGITWTELYFKSDPETPIPDWHVSIIGAYAGEVEIPPTNAISAYSEIEHTDIYFDASTREIHFVMGSAINRNHSAGVLFSDLESVTFHKLTRQIVGSGTTNISPSRFKYVEDSNVSVEAFTTAGWLFDHWLLDSVNVGDSNLYTVTMNKDHNLTAVFTEVSPETPDEENHIPYAIITVNSTTVTLDQVVIFNANNSYDLDGQIELYFFDFGDGTNSGWISSSTISHTYSIEGNYTVSLMVKDDKGSTSVSESTMYVSLTVIPEFPSWIILPLLLITGLIIQSYRKRMKKVVKLKNFL